MYVETGQGRKTKLPRLVLSDQTGKQTQVCLVPETQSQSCQPLDSQTMPTQLESMGPYNHSASPLHLNPWLTSIHLEISNYHFYFQLCQNIHLSNLLLLCFSEFAMLYMYNISTLHFQGFRIPAHSYKEHTHTVLPDSLFWMKHNLILCYQTHFTNE